MLKKLLPMTLFAFASVSQANDQYRQFDIQMKAHDILVYGAKALEVTVHTKFIEDGCNRAAISGKFAEISYPNAKFLYKPYFGDFYVAQTELFCPEDIPDVEVELSETQRFEVQNEETGRIGVRLYLPASYKVSFNKITE